MHTRSRYVMMDSSERRPTTRCPYFMSVAVSVALTHFWSNRLLFALEV
jgi:hypothetical protein